MNLLMRCYDKSIRLTDKTPIYQYDSLMDCLRVLVPKYYRKHDLSEFTCIMTYMLPDATVSNVTLELDEEPYNDDYLSYHLPISHIYTSQVGHVNVELVFVKSEEEVTYMLTTQIAKIRIVTNGEMSGDIDPSTAEKLEAEIANIKARLNEEVARITNIEDNGLKIVL